MYEFEVSLHRQVYYGSAFQHSNGGNVEKGSISEKSEVLENSQEITSPYYNGFGAIKLDNVDELSDKLEFYSRRYGGI